MAPTERPSHSAHKILENLDQKLLRHRVLIKRQIKIDLVGVIPELHTHGRVAVNVPRRPMLNRAHFQPEIVIFGDAVKIVDKVRLIDTTDVVQIVEKQVRAPPESSPIRRNSF